MNIDPNFKLSVEIKANKDHKSAFFWALNSIQKRMFYRFKDVDNLFTVGILKFGKPIEFNGGHIISVDTSGMCQTDNGYEEVIDYLDIDILIAILEKVEE